MEDKFSLFVAYYFSTNRLKSAAQWSQISGVAKRCHWATVLRPQC